MNWPRLILFTVPQDAFLHSGTMRSNLDPFGVHDDARLNDALQRAHLIEPAKTEQIQALDSGGNVLPSADTPIPNVARILPNRFSLDTPVDEGGANLSVGQVESFASRIFIGRLITRARSRDH